MKYGLLNTIRHNCMSYVVNVHAVLKAMHSQVTTVAKLLLRWPSCAGRFAARHARLRVHCWRTCTFLLTGVRNSPRRRAPLRHVQKQAACLATARSNTTATPPLRFQRRRHSRPAVRPAVIVDSKRRAVGARIRTQLSSRRTKRAPNT